MPPCDLLRSSAEPCDIVSRPHLNDCLLPPCVRERLAKLISDPAGLPDSVSILLRAKLEGAASGSLAECEGRALPERRVVYMVSGGGAQSAYLTAEGAPQAGKIPVSSLLGATLLGMGRLQKAPLPQESGTVATLVVLGVSDS